MASINWNSELARLEREFDGLPPRPTAEELRQKRELRSHQTERSTTIAVWARLVLVVSLAGALAFWPYAADCGVGLYGFMGAAAMVAVGGIWVAVCTWRHRMPLAHILALGLFLVGLGTVAHQILPRSGYAGIDRFNAPQWSCSSAQPSRAWR